MNNHAIASKAVSFEKWLSKPLLKTGFISVYDGEDFDGSINSSAYEIGRQMAVVAKTRGFKTKGGLIRRKPKSEEFAWVKTKMGDIESLARSLGFNPRTLVIRNKG